jgi:hypothetical protein
MSNHRRRVLRLELKTRVRRRGAAVYAEIARRQKARSESELQTGAAAKEEEPEHVA